LSWTVIDDATYQVSFSTDLIRWNKLSMYSYQSAIDTNGNLAEVDIDFNYKYMHFFIRIEAYFGSQVTYSNVYEFYVELEDLYADEMVPYIVSEFEMFVRETGIYK
ncbi:MAG: hypothetical protein J5666_07230, partial [Bacilli bacterium]|nr:hypothetical protein [Bacilli bacterium]